MPLTDLILATSDEAEEIATSDYPLGKWKGIDTKGIDVVPYSILYCLLFNQEWQSEVLDKFPLVSQETNEGPWVSIFPDEMTQTLANLGENESRKIASSWAEIEEMTMFDFRIINRLIYEIRDLAKEAVSSNKDILILMCL